jgi:hypothetical protein
VADDKSRRNNTEWHKTANGHVETLTKIQTKILDKPKNMAYFIYLFESFYSAQAIV